MGLRSETKLGHVVEAVFRWTVVDCVAFREENDAVKHHEYFGGRLVNGCDYCCSSIGLSSEQLADKCACIGV